MPLQQPPPPRFVRASKQVQPASARAQPSHFGRPNGQSKPSPDIGCCARFVRSCNSPASCCCCYSRRRLCGRKNGQFLRRLNSLALRRRLLQQTSTKEVARARFLLPPPPRSPLPLSRLLTGGGAPYFFVGGKYTTLSLSVALQASKTFQSQSSIVS